MAWTQRQANPWVVLPDVARTFDMGGGEARILVSAEQSGGAWWLGSSMHSKVFSPYGWMASGTTGALVVARLGGRCTRWETVASSRSAFWFREILRDLRFFPRSRSASSPFAAWQPPVLCRVETDLRKVRLGTPRTSTQRLKSKRCLERGVGPYPRSVELDGEGSGSPLYKQAREVLTVMKSQNSPKNRHHDC